MSKRRLLTTCLRFTLYALGVVGAILLYAGLVADMHEPPCSRPWYGDGRPREGVGGLEERRGKTAGTATVRPVKRP
jgi:hypothetical protein